jgi:GTP 3',8-cyclase
MSTERFIDPSTIRKEGIVKENLTTIEGFPVFSIVEFNIAGNCNRTCSFCPVSDPKVYHGSKELMDIEVYRKIVTDLADIHYEGKILYSAFSEPLLHKEIEVLIKITKDKLPKSRVEIVSNGDLITEKKLQKLFDSGLDTISISMYDGPEQKEYFGKMMTSLGLSDSQVVLRRRYFENGNYGITISNRAGIINSNEYRDEKEEQVSALPLKQSCYYPFYMTLIDMNGNMLLCPHDWSKTMVFGNTMQNHIWELWKSKTIETTRKILAKDNRNFKPCDKCDVDGKVMGTESYLAWKESK